MAGKDSSPDRNTRFVESSRGILTYTQLAPLIAERVLACEEALVAGAFDDCPLDERLLVQFHRMIFVRTYSPSGQAGGDVSMFESVICVRPSPIWCPK